MDMECEAKLNQSTYGKVYPYNCGKPSKFQDENGRSLCKNHFLKWFLKKYGQEYEDFIKKMIIINI